MYSHSPTMSLDFRIAEVALAIIEVDRDRWTGLIVRAQDVFQATCRTGENLCVAAEAAETASAHTSELRGTVRFGELSPEDVVRSIQDSQQVLGDTILRWIAWELSVCQHETTLLAVQRKGPG